MNQQASGIGLSYSKSPLSAAGGGGRAPFRRGFYSGAWELFRDAKGSGFLVRPDAYVAARFERADAAQAEQYLADRVGGASLVNEARMLPEDAKPAAMDLQSAGLGIN